MDLSGGAGGKITISNKPSRVDELREALDSIMCWGVIVPNRLPSVLGKLQYADSQVWGRAGKLALADLRELGHTSPASVALGETQVEAFVVLKSRLCSGKPKAFLADEVTKPVLIFTDGALEYEQGLSMATIGAVYMDPFGRTEVFGAEVPGSVMEDWTSNGKTHVIGLLSYMHAWFHWSTGKRRTDPDGSYFSSTLACLGRSCERDVPTRRLEAIAIASRGSERRQFLAVGR